MAEPTLSGMLGTEVLHDVMEVMLRAHERPIRVALDAFGHEMTAGKQQLAANITEKGQSTDPTDSLMQMAENVHNIQMQNYEISGQEVKDAQNYADGTLYDLYEVFYQVKNSPTYQNNYACFILCEYFRGYDSLILQNADGYLTCDGDYYDGAVTHIWHDENTGKADRWVAYLFRNEGASYQIPDTARCPRSMYIGGNVGQIQCLFDGRIYEVVVPDEVVNGVQVNTLNDLYFSGTQVWQKNVVIKNVKEFRNGSVIRNNTNVITYVDYSETHTTSSVVANSNSNLVFAKFPRLKRVNSSINQDGIVTSCSSLVILELPELEIINCQSGAIYYQLVRRDTKLEKILAPKLASYNGQRLFTIDNADNALKLIYTPSWVIGLKNSNVIGYSNQTPNLEDVWVGETAENINFREWNPTNVIARGAEAIEQLNENIRNHIAARVSDRTGQSALTFTVSTNLYNNLEQATKDAFTAKNWNVVGA